MPHAESDTMGDPAMTNGERATSQFISHLLDYPIIFDSVETFKSNPYGQKSISLADNTYHKFAKPYASYFQTPYSIVAPYIAKADSLGDAGLTKVDERFPIVKSETSQLKDTVVSFAGFPLKVAKEGKEYVFGTYGSEYKKCGGDGYVAGGKALISTTLVITSESLAWVSAYLAKKKTEAKDMYNEKTSNSS